MDQKSRPQKQATHKGGCLQEITLGNKKSKVLAIFYNFWVPVLGPPNGTILIRIITSGPKNGSIFRPQKWDRENAKFVAPECVWDRGLGRSAGASINAVEFPQFKDGCSAECNDGPNQESVC